jgi:hypothetical protein
MNLIKEYPRFVTFIILVITFIYCGYFTQNISNVLNPQPIQENLHAYQSGTVQQTGTVQFEIRESSVSEILNEAAWFISKRIEQGIRQTSHFIGN